ncbi:GNAT family N-acetyltransferase [Devosia sp. XK-2]|uniref:GNAT family N-acetyltransferase n=1 Tax=Devosia sp. XK-2 TaxID=3126689 RepID=UPI0030CF00D6
MTVDIRTLDLDDIETLIDWAAAEGWNPGVVDASAFHAADPKGFLGAFVDGVMVAGISVVAYDDDFGFLGLYICHPDFRGQGYGRAVWDAGMTYLGNRIVGLDGVPEQQANYQRMGFAADYETVRMGGVLRRVAARHCHIEVLDSVEPVRDVDQACFPARRDRFLEAWISPPHQALVAMRDGQPCGYMVVRACRKDRKIGPLFAADLASARDLIGAIEGVVQIDVPQYQTGLLAELDALGFSAQFRTARMYRGPAPALRREQIFGVTSLELG